METTALKTASYAETYADATGQYTKLPNGTWGLRVSANSLKPGDIVLVTTKAGAQKLETVEAIVPSKYAGPGTVFASIKPSAKFAKNADPVTKPGMFLRPDGAIFYAKWNKAGTNLYAERYNPATFKFTYEAPAIYTLTEAMRMNADAVLALPYRVGRCIFCSLKLTDPKSLARGDGRGIGPICFKKYF